MLRHRRAMQCLLEILAVKTVVVADDDGMRRVAIEVFKPLREGLAGFAGIHTLFVARGARRITAVWLAQGLETRLGEDAGSFNL
jgi:hypothetical protein